MYIIVSTFIIICSLFIASNSLPQLDLSQSRIVNGYAVDITEVPYQATLRRRAVSGWTHLCGAAVIGSNALLTAAHCVTLYQGTPTLIRVNVGTSDRLSNGKNYDLKRVIIHEDYSSSSLENDIALLVTQKKISYSQSVKAINIASKTYNLPNGTQAIVSGYGAVSYQGSSSPVLLAAKVNIVDVSVCRRAYLGIASISDKMICAGADNPPRDACQGDSGGPLVTDNVLIGIVSWGEKCADPLYPGVYTRVSEYESWVISRVNQYT